MGVYAVLAEGLEARYRCAPWVYAANAPTFTTTVRRSLLWRYNCALCGPDGMHIRNSH